MLVWGEAEQHPEYLRYHDNNGNLIIMNFYTGALVVLFSGSLLAQDGSEAHSSTMSESNTSKEIEKPLDISGQNRNLSMMMILKNDRDEINFVEVRTNFEDEVLKTTF